MRVDNPLNFTLVGYGKMGHAIEKAALARGHSIASRISKSDPDAHFQTIFSASVNRADVAIEFTHPTLVLEHVKLLAELKKPIVIGTTGWYDQIDEVKALCDKHGIGIVYAPNFSLGINLFAKILEHAGEIFDNFPEYDAAGQEWHHKDKADNPSGTAKMLAEILLKTLSRKKKPLYETPDRKIHPEEVMFTGTRCGLIPGTHEVRFDSSEDTLILRHEARSREGFALGAVMAAEWIKGKQGFYPFGELMNEILGGKQDA